MPIYICVVHVPSQKYRRQGRGYVGDEARRTDDESFPGHFIELECVTNSSLKAELVS